MKNSIIFSRKICKNILKFLINSQKISKYLEKVLRKFENVKKVEKIYLKIGKTFKQNLRQLCKNIRKFSLSSQ